MARIFMDGFEYGKPLFDDNRDGTRTLYDYNDSMWKYYCSGFHFNGVDSTAFNGGNYSMRFYRYVSGTTGGASCLYKELDSTYNTLFCRMNVRFVLGSDMEATFFSLDNSTYITDTSLQLKHNPLNFALYVYVNGSKVATVTDAFVGSAWHCLEVMYDYDTSNIIVKIDSSQVVDYSGSLESAINHVIIGRNDTASMTQAMDMFIDDLAINDDTGTVNNSWVGTGLIRMLNPTADGSNSDFTPSTGGDNYAMVDEIVTDNDSTYNYSTTANNIDTFTFPNVDTVDASQTINAVQALFRARSEDAAAQISPILISGVTTDTGTAQQTYLSDYVDMKYEIYDVDPNTSAQWTEANVNAVEGGYKHINV